MDEIAIAKLFVSGAVIGGVIVHLFWATKFRKHSDFLYYMRRGYSADVAWMMAKE